MKEGFVFFLFLFVESGGPHAGVVSWRTNKCTERLMKLYELTVREYKYPVGNGIRKKIE